MRMIVIAFATGAALAMGAPGAEAAPMQAVYGASDAPALVYVSGGCGPAGHRNGFGRCVPNFFRPVVRCFVRPTPYGPRRICR